MSEEEQQKPKWQVLHRIERRVVGVLVEKAKTTPNAYPLTLNSLTNGCNQKSNRYPEMTLQPNQVEDALENLRGMGAVAEVAGGGRVAKFRHYMYEWLGVEQQELAVMAELLLRGGQTVGELRGRAARMDPIPDVNTLKPILASLIEKGLVISLTPEGRGQVVTHALFNDDEMEKERKRVLAAAAMTAEGSSAPTKRSSASRSSDVEELKSELAELRSTVEQMRVELDQLKTHSS